MKKNQIILVLLLFITVSSRSAAQTLASKRTAAQGRYNLEKSFADSQRKIFAITSWAGAEFSDLLGRWGNFTRKNQFPNGLMVYTFEQNYSGSGGSYEPGYTVTDQYGNILDEKKSEDTRYSYNFTDIYEFYVDKNGIIIHVKIVAQ